MNKISYKIEIQESSNFYPNVFRAYIDDIKTDSFFDLAGLEVSRTLGGVCPIFVCPCGYMGCTGYYVWSYILPNEVVWSNFYAKYADEETAREGEGEKDVYLLKNFSGAGPEFIVNPPLRFDQNEYDKVVAEMISQLPMYEAERSMFENDLRDYKSGNRFHA